MLYLLIEAHPLEIKKKILTLEITINTIGASVIFTTIEAMGETNQIINDKVINITGENHIKLCILFFSL